MAALVRSSIVALAILFAVAAPASADVSDFGSDLSQPANMVESHGPDTAFWNIQLEGGQGVRAPADGQITSARVKGIVVQDPAHRIQPMTMFHFQVLHPMGDGTLEVMLSSGAFYTPLGGDPQQINTYDPVNLCVHKGDIVDFNDIGGFQYRWGNYAGMPFQVFSRVPGSTMNTYSADNGTNVGSRWAPAETKKGAELLMQTTLSTGPDATDICPGGYQQHVFKGVDVKTPQLATVRTRARYVKVRALCPGPSYGSCIGDMTLEATLAGKRIRLGSQHFQIARGTTPSVQIPLSKATVKLIQKAKLVGVKVVADAHDVPDSYHRSTGVPVQHQTTGAQITVRPDKLIQARHKKKHLR
jgi:hypothetical protein